MNDLIEPLDWFVIGLYLVALISLSAWLSRRQHSRGDYYVAGRHTGPWPIAVSILATQCSTNSILGAPAFVAFAAGGGLIWLQYELAVPIAMIFIMVFLLPMFRSLSLISVYEYLERRFDLSTRLLLSGVFQFVRAFATAVTVYSISLVIELISGLSFFWSVVLLGVITVVYDILGGIRAVIYSDVIQMLILVAVLLALFTLLLSQVGGFEQLFNQLPEDRRAAVDFSHHGLGDGKDFAFWPMLFGGILLYVSYYGCDQSQVQRELCARNVDDGNRALMINGLLRFPLVLLYCLIGAGLAVYAAGTPDFISALPISGDAPNYNLAVPLYMLQQLPAGVVGIALVALFAAAMSSLDSVINSLSATTMEDFVRRFHRGETWSDTRELIYARLLTALWGVVTLVLAFYVDDIADTVLVAINKIGSLINGPVLAVFALGILTKRCNGLGAKTGLIAGFALNLYCWQFLPNLSWLWWNVFGALTTLIVGLGVSLTSARPLQDLASLVWSRGRYQRFGFELNWLPRYAALLLYFLVLLAVLMQF
ncbi:MAG: sodium:solute symporter [Pseudomonadota bacterium]